MYCNCVCCVLFHVAVDCGTAPVITGAIPQYTSQAATTYASSPLRYECATGYWFARDKTNVEASCTANGKWKVDGSTIENSWPSCIRKYRQLTVEDPGELLPGIPPLDPNIRRMLCEVETQSLSVHLVYIFTSYTGCRLCRQARAKNSTLSSI